MDDSPTDEKAIEENRQRLVVFFSWSATLT